MPIHDEDRSDTRRIFVNKIFSFEGDKMVTRSSADPIGVKTRYLYA